MRRWGTGGNGQGVKVRGYDKVEFEVKNLEVFIHHFAHFDILFGILYRDKRQT